MKTHKPDAGTPALTTSKNPIKPGPTSDFAPDHSTGAHHILGGVEVRSATNAGARVATTTGSASKDNSPRRG